MNRPSFPTIYMELAELMSARSTCQRLSVGCVITTPDYRKVLAVGYNGNAAGLPNKCDANIPGKCGCLHAEDNAVINCDAPRATHKHVFVTHVPCVMCSKRIINLGNVEKVFYKYTHRCDKGLELLAQAGITTICL